MSVSIRPIGAADEARWRALGRGYLDFYGTSVEEEVTANTFRRLNDDERFLGLVAEVEDEVVGIVHCVFHPVTGSLNDYCYLEDIFVDINVRGRGAGRALIEAVYKEADRRGCVRIYWNTHKDNATAQTLYDKLATLSDFVQYRRV